MRKAVLPAVLIALLGTTYAQEPDYSALLRRCSQHEKEAMERSWQFQFQERVEYDWGSETRRVIETGEGRVDRIVAFNDQPLYPDQQNKQQQRLTKLLKSPDALRQEIADQKEESKRRQLMVVTLPDAVTLQFSAKEPDGTLSFDFSPDPKFSPKDQATQILKGMRGV